MFHLGRDEENPGLTLELTHELVQEGKETLWPILKNSWVLSRDKVNCILLVVKEELDFEDVEGVDNKGAREEEEGLYD